MDRIEQAHQIYVETTTLDKLLVKRIKPLVLKI